MVNKLVTQPSWTREKPSTSKSRTARRLSQANSGMPSARITASASGMGQYARSQAA